MKHGKMYLELNFSFHFPLHIKLDDQLGDLLTAVVSEDAEVGTIVNVDMGLSNHDASAWVILQTWRKVVLVDKSMFQSEKESENTYLTPLVQLQPDQRMGRQTGQGHWDIFRGHQGQCSWSCHDDDDVSDDITNLLSPLDVCDPQCKGRSCFLPDQVLSDTRSCQPRILRKHRNDCPCEHWRGEHWRAVDSRRRQM